MTYSIYNSRRLCLGLIVAPMFAASVSFAQSSGSDTDYLSALDSMVVNMDLDGLADQTFEATTVDAPRLSAMAAGASIVDCSTVMAQSEASGSRIEIFGADPALTDEQMAALAKCMMPETGTVMSYLLPNS